MYTSEISFVAFSEFELIFLTKFFNGSNINHPVQLQFFAAAAKGFF
jgi:hypothetical protein